MAATTAQSSCLTNAVTIRVAVRSISAKQIGVDSRKQVKGEGAPGNCNCRSQGREVLTSLGKVTSFISLVSCSSSVSNISGGINGHFGRPKGRRSKVAAAIKRNSRSYLRAEWLPHHFNSCTGDSAKTSRSQANDVSGSEGENFQSYESALGEVQGRKNQENEVAV
jgi:hypothetical protein